VFTAFTPAGPLLTVTLATLELGVTVEADPPPMVSPPPPQEITEMHRTKAKPRSAGV
jgi:hypothetical protein